MYIIIYYKLCPKCRGKPVFFFWQPNKKNAKQARLDEKKARVAETPTSCWKIPPPAA